MSKSKWVDFINIIFLTHFILNLDQDWKFYIYHPSKKQSMSNFVFNDFELL
jgi:hypothetical protein